jgi:hypothetical protein
MAYHRQMNREPSLERFVFQITRTTIYPNYPGEELETLDREVLVISADVPPQDRETDEQRQERENTNATRATRRQQELAAIVPAAGQQPGNAGQVNDNVVALAPPAAPQPRQQGNEPRANCLRARDLLSDFEQDGLQVYNSPQTNLGAALAALNHLEDSPTVRRLQANVCVTSAQIEERGPGYSRSAASSYSCKFQPILQPTLQPMHQPMPPPTLPTMPPTMRLMLPTPKKTQLQTQGKTQELDLHQCKPIVPKVVSDSA